MANIPDLEDAQAYGLVSWGPWREMVCTNSLLT